MENKIRFRNHFSMVLPNLKGFVWIFFMAFLSGIMGKEGGFSDAMISVLTWIAIAVVLLIYQIVIWAKTWITIGEQSIIIECNTFFSRKKNTIGIKNISNINLEQSLMCMLFGTSKLKLDTNSLSTANATDLTIVLKKRQAEELRLMLINLVSGVDMRKHEVNPEIKVEVKADSNCLRVSTGDILLHGVFASRFLYTIFIPLYILLEFVSEMDSSDIEYIVDEVGYFAAETIGLWLLILIALVAWGILAMVFGLARDAVRYWDFQIERKEEKIVLTYGLTKKVNYSIPVDKIQALVVKQTALARIFRRYMVEVINVGMNDDEKEAKAFLLPYGKKIVLMERIQSLLPEFEEHLDFSVERQPKSIWIVSLWGNLMFMLFMGAIPVIIAQLVPEIIGVAISGVVIIILAVLAIELAEYLTKGSKFGEFILTIVTGAFARKFVFVKYDKIQYVRLHQNFIAKHFGIQTGTAQLLASMKNQIQAIPYFKEEKVQILKERLNKKHN